MANVLKKLTRESSLLAPDLRSFKRQESSFVVLNLFVLAALLLYPHAVLLHSLAYRPDHCFAALSAGFLINVIELIWLQGAASLSPTGIVALTWFTISLNMALGFSLASLSYRQDTQYFTLFVVPILQAAFRLSFSATVAVVVASTTLDFFWVWNYFRLHPPPDIHEYTEAGTISLIYAIVGILVWKLVNHLRSKQEDLAASLVALESAKEQLLIDEKLTSRGAFFQCDRARDPQSCCNDLKRPRYCAGCEWARGSGNKCLRLLQKRHHDSKDSPAIS